MHLLDDPVQLLHAVVVIAGLPVVVFRVWRWRVHRPSVTMAAAAAFAGSLWTGVLTDIRGVWTALPLGVQAFHVGGGILVVSASSLSLLALGVSGRATTGRVRAIVAVSCAIVAVVALLCGHAAGSGPVTAPQEYVGSRALLAASLLTHSYVALVLVQWSWLGARHADRSPAGIGLRLLAAAALIELLPMIRRGIWGELVHGRADGAVTTLQPSDWIPTAIAGGLFVASFLYPPIAARRQARRQLRVLAPLHQMLHERFPGLAPPDPRWIGLPDLVFERSAQILDAVSLAAQLADLPDLPANPIPQDPDQRADDVIAWLVADSSQAASIVSIQKPADMNGTQWALCLARAYRRHHDGAFPSEMTSTLQS